MEELSREDVERTARLARLELTEESAERLAGEMASVLRHFREIRRLDREAGEAAGHDEGGSDAPAGGGGPGEDPGAAAFREDEVDPDVLERPPSALAPAWRDGHFVVPRLPSLGEEGDR